MTRKKMVSKMAGSTDMLNTGGGCSKTQDCEGPSSIREAWRKNGWQFLTAMAGAFTLLLVLVMVMVTVMTTTAMPNVTVNKFPKGFLKGVATSAYQIEGAWNVDGKGESVMDYYYHLKPSLAADWNNGDVACNSYNLYKDDVKLVKNLNANVYRFSISWSRILPYGDFGVVNQKGIDYYNKLIDELVANNIEPMVTMFHWDTPQFLQHMGGFTNPDIVQTFTDYAELLFQLFGDRVKWWITFNEPEVVGLGYELYGVIPPSLNATGRGFYLVLPTVLTAHARVYRLYQRQFKQKQKGKIGITLTATWAEPIRTPDDLEAVEASLQYTVGLWAHPIYSKEGGYPEGITKRVAKLSAKEGRKRTRLPKLNKEQVKYIKGTADFIGFNYYRMLYVTSKNTGIPIYDLPDIGVFTNTTLTGYNMAEGFRKILRWVRDQYPGYPIVVTENGYVDDGKLDDVGRKEYHMSHLAAMLEAIHVDKVPVLGYTAWSLMDNFEWNKGYTERYGLYHVDFSNPERPRTPKKSVKALRDVYRKGEVPISYFN